MIVADVDVALRCVAHTMACVTGGVEASAAGTAAGSGGIVMASLECLRGHVGARPALPGGAQLRAHLN